MVGGKLSVFEVVLLRAIFLACRTKTQSTSKTWHSLRLADVTKSTCDAKLACFSQAGSHHVVGDCLSDPHEQLKGLADKCKLWKHPFATQQQAIPTRETKLHFDSASRSTHRNEVFVNNSHSLAQSCFK
jgi:hypothetical protein